MRKAMWVFIMGLFLAFPLLASAQQETFESYTDGTVLAEVNSSNVTVTEINGWEAATGIHTGNTRKLTIGTDSGNMYAVSSGSRGVFWKKSSAIAAAFASNAIQILDFSFYNDGQTWDDSIEVWLGACSDGGGTSIKKIINVRTGNTDYRNIGLYTPAAGIVGEADNATDFPANTWMNVKVIIDTTANGGQGKVSVAYKMSSAAYWTLEPALQNVQIGLLMTGYEAVNQPAEWGGFYFDIMNGGRIDNVSASAVATAPDLPLPPPVTIDFEGYTSGTILAGAAADNSVIAEIDNWFVCQGVFTGDRILAVGEEAGNKYAVVPVGSSRGAFWKSDPAIATTFASNAIQILDFSFRCDDQWWDDNIIVWLGACADWSADIKKMIEIRVSATNYRNVGLWTPSAGIVGEPSTQDFPANTWMNMKVIIDTTANGGQGKVSVAYKLASSTGWTLEPALQNVQIGLLTAGYEAINQPSEWSKIGFDIMNGNRIDNVSASAVATAPELPLPPPVTIDFENYDNGTVLASVGADNIIITEIDNWFVAQGIHSGERSLTVGEEAGNKYAYVSGLRGVFWKSDPGFGAVFDARAIQVVEYSFWNDGQNWDDSVLMFMGKGTDWSSDLRQLFSLRAGHTSYRNVGLWTPALGAVVGEVNVQDFQAMTWIDVKVIIYPAAYSGNGSISVAYKPHTATYWTREPALQNVQIGLSTFDANYNEPKEWLHICFDMHNGGRIDNINAYSVATMPEFPTPPAEVVTLPSVNVSLSGGKAFNRDILGQNRAITGGLELSNNAALRGPAGGGIAESYGWKTQSGITCPDTTLGFLRNVRDRNADPLVTVNARGTGTGTGWSDFHYTDITVPNVVSLAEDWVRYCNGTLFNWREGQTPTGADLAVWNAITWTPKLLSTSESLTPKVGYWEIGNEPDIAMDGWVLSGTEYRDRYNAIVAAMRAVDPTIKVGPCATVLYSGNPVRAVTQDPSARVDFVSYHPYGSKTVGWGDAGQMETHLRGVKPLQASIYDGARGALLADGRNPDAVEYICSEWSPTSWEEAVWHPSIHQALGAAETVFTYADLGIRMANYWANLYSSFNSPAYKLFETMRDAMGDVLVNSYTDGNNFRLYTVKNTANGQITLWALNFDYSADVSIQHLSLTNLPGAGYRITKKVLDDPDGTDGLMARNVGTVEVDWSSQDLTGTLNLSDFALTVPNASIALLVLEPLLAGDVNGDGVVNTTDLSAVLANMDSAVPSGLTDQDGDGQFTSSDLAVVLANLP